MYQIVMTPGADRDLEECGSPEYRERVRSLLQLLQEDPYRENPSYEALTGNLTGYYVRKINLFKRLVYQVEDAAEKLMEQENGKEDTDAGGTVKIIGILP